MIGRRDWRTSRDEVLRDRTAADSAATGRRQPKGLMPPAALYESNPVFARERTIYLVSVLTPIKKSSVHTKAYETR